MGESITFFSTLVKVFSFVRFSFYSFKIFTKQKKLFSARFRPNVTPNAQESEDSGLGSLVYSSTEAAKRMSSSSSSINSEQDHDRDIYDDDARELRQHGPPPSMNVVNGSGGHDFRYASTKRNGFICFFLTGFCNTNTLNLWIIK